MRKELSDQLHEMFPKLFAHVSFECGDGWYQLILDTAYEIEKEIMIQGFDPEDTYATQVKEKYGELRIYITGGSDTIFDIIEKAQEDSKSICEQCGKLGRWVNINKSYFTTCEDCEPK